MTTEILKQPMTTNQVETQSLQEPTLYKLLPGLYLSSQAWSALSESQTPEEPEYEDGEPENGGDSDSESPSFEEEEMQPNCAEQEFFYRNTEIETAVAFAKELLKTGDNPKVLYADSFAYECLEHIKAQYEETRRGRVGVWVIDDIKQDVRLGWDQKFLNFVRAKIWEKLGRAGLLSQPWSSGCRDRVYNEIFGQLHAAIFKFTGEVIELTVNFLRSYEYFGF